MAEVGPARSALGPRRARGGVGTGTAPAPHRPAPAPRHRDLQAVDRLLRRPRNADPAGFSGFPPEARRVERLPVVPDAPDGVAAWLAILAAGGRSDRRNQRRR